jgi:hypothetical protein
VTKYWNGSCWKESSETVEPRLVDVGVVENLLDAGAALREETAIELPVVEPATFTLYEPVPVLSVEPLNVPPIAPPNVEEQRHDRERIRTEPLIVTSPVETPVEATKNENEIVPKSDES